MDNLVGKKFNTEKLGCGEPLLVFYPDESKDFKYIEEIKYIYDALKSRFSEVNDLQKNDILVFEFNNIVHIGVYLGDDKFIHSTKLAGWHITKLNKYKLSLKYIFRKSS